MSNAYEILNQLQRKCRGEHEHEHLLNDRAGPAAHYPEDLCRAICRGLVRQIEHQRQHVRHLLSVEAGTVAGERPEEEEDEWMMDLQDAWDDVSGKALDPMKVRAARKLEMEYINGKRVWRKISRKEALAQGLQNRWNKMDRHRQGRREPA